MRVRRSARNNAQMQLRVVLARPLRHGRQGTRLATGKPIMRREQLTDKILDIKREKGSTWKYICDEIGGAES